MSARAVLLTCLALAGCHPLRSCRDGTLFVDLSGASGADHVRVDVTIGARTYSGTQPYAGQAGLEIDFPTGYPAATSARVTVTAMHGASVVARASTSATLPRDCAHLAIALAPVDGGSGGAGGSDGGGSDGGGSDGGHDLAPAATVTVVGTRAQPPAPTSTATLALPSGTQAGDFVVFTVYANSTSSVAQLPQNWFVQAQVASPKGFQVYWLTRAADAALTAPTVTFSGTPLVSAAIIAYHGSGTTPTIDAQNSPDTLTGTSTTSQIVFSAPAITPKHASDRLLAVFVWDSGDGQTWIQAPSGTSKLVDTGSIGLFDGPFSAVPPGTVDATADFTASDGAFGTALVAAIAP